MRILLDECVPAKLARSLPDHEIRTVPRMRWSGLRDTVLLRSAAGEFDAFITVDRSMQHQVTPPAGLIFLILHVPNNSAQAVAALAPEILEALNDASPGVITHVGTLPRIDPPAPRGR